MEFSKLTYILLSGITALSIVTLSIPSIIKVAKAKNLYDYPDSRKSHRNTIPTLGGLAIFAGLIIAVLMWTDFKSNTEIKFILAAIILVFFIGLKDDILVIAPDKKLIAQLVAALILVVLGNIRITNLHGFIGIHEIPYMASLLLTLFVIVVVLNGMNLIDGIDGLASGVGIVASLSFGIYFYKVEQFEYVIFISALLGTLMAFFVFNVFGKKNKIFMGDTGSLILGLILAVFAIKFNEFNASPATGLHFSSAPSVSIGILMVPLFDTIRVFIIRILKGKSPFRADNNHVHHRLLQLGFTHLKATVFIVMSNLLFIAIAFFMDGLGILNLLLVLSASAIVLSLIPVLMLKFREQKYEQPVVFPKTYLNTIKLLLEDTSDQYYINKSVEQKFEEKEYAEKVKVS